MQMFKARDNRIQNKINGSVSTKDLGIKSQAALEFLVTYGWAILSVLIVISALAYFGVFNTTRYVNDMCDFGDQMRCEDSVLYSNSTLGFKLRNNFGVSIDITKVTLKSDYGQTNCLPAATVPNTNIMPSDLFEVKCNISSSTIPVGEKRKIKAVVEFKKTGANNPLHNQTGEILKSIN